MKTIKNVFFGTDPSISSRVKMLNPQVWKSEWLLRCPQYLAEQRGAFLFVIISFLSVSSISRTQFCTRRASSMTFATWRLAPTRSSATTTCSPTLLQSILRMQKLGKIRWVFGAQIRSFSLAIILQENLPRSGGECGLPLSRKLLLQNLSWCHSSPKKHVPAPHQENSGWIDFSAILEEPF